MGGKDDCKERPEAAAMSDILLLFGEANFMLV